MSIWNTFSHNLHVGVQHYPSIKRGQTTAIMHKHLCNLNLQMKKVGLNSQHQQWPQNGLHKPLFGSACCIFPPKRPLMVLFEKICMNAIVIYPFWNVFRLCSALPKWMMYHITYFTSMLSMLSMRFIRLFERHHGCMSGVLRVPAIKQKNLPPPLRKWRNVSILRNSEKPTQLLPSLT